MALALCLVVTGCTKPPARGLEDLYARRPDVAGLDTSVLHGRRILIDPGHGGAFAGSRGRGDTREADVNLGVALYLWGLLRDAGADVHLTRASDRDLLPTDREALRDDLEARVALLDSLRPDVFLSLHHNSNAELDRERNAIETYFKLDDAGPSYDLARSIHRRLASVLGIERGALRPGNYYVLRNANTTAVLGEASYLSNPDVESRLQLAEKQLLEAEAYFLGLLDYFARGVPRIVARTAHHDTLRTGESLQLFVESSVGLDPLSVQLFIDAAPWPIDFDPRTAIATLQVTPDLPPGAHEFELRARNLRGNAARAWKTRLHVYAPAASLLESVFPSPAAPGSDVRIDVRVLDAWNRPIANGVRLQFEPTDLAVLVADTTTVRGQARVYVRTSGAASRRLAVRVEQLHADLSLRVDPTAVARRLTRCVDARRGTPLPGVDLECFDGRRERSDHHGAVLLPVECDSLRARKRGYVPWLGSLDVDVPLALDAVSGGQLLGTRIVLDPGGDGNEATAPGLGISAAELSWHVTSYLGELLRGTGAEVQLTRGASDIVPEPERVRVASRHRADFYVRIESSLDVNRCARVLHYPGSVVGERLARGVARWLSATRCDSVATVADSRYVLQQTPCPAVVVQLPGPVALEQRAAAAHADSLRRQAYALLVGLRVALEPRVATWPPLEVNAPRGAQPDALAVLDGVEALRPDRAGRARFEHVAPGVHQLLWFSGGASPVEAWVTTSATDTTRVTLTAPVQP